MGKNDVSSLAIKVSARDVGVNVTLRRIYGKVASFASATKTVVLGATAALATVGTVVALKMSEAAERIDEAGKAAERLGVLPEELSAAAYAARMANVQTSEFYGNIEKLTKKISEANSGDKGAIATFEELRLSSRELASMGLQRRLELIANALGSMGDKSDRLRLSMELFGKSGSGMINMLAGGVEGLRAMVQEAKELNQVVSQYDAIVIDKRNDAIDRAKAAIEGAWNRMTVEVAPALTVAMDNLTAAIKSVDWKSVGSKAKSAVKGGVDGWVWVTGGFKAVSSYAGSVLLEMRRLGVEWKAKRERDQALLELNFREKVPKYFGGGTTEGTLESLRRRAEIDARFNEQMKRSQSMAEVRDAMWKGAAFDMQDAANQIKINAQKQAEIHASTGDAVQSPASKGFMSEADLKAAQDQRKQGQKLATSWMKDVGRALRERAEILQSINSAQPGEIRPGVFSDMRKKGSYAELQARAGVVENVEAARERRERDLIEANKRLAEVNQNISTLLRDVVVGIRGLTGFGTVGF